MIDEREQRHVMELDALRTENQMLHTEIAKKDTEIARLHALEDLNHIERCCQLHEHVEVYYEVDRYRAVLRGHDDSLDVLSICGETVSQAIAALNAALESWDLTRVHAVRGRVPDIPSPCPTLPDPATYGYDPPVPRLVTPKDEPHRTQDYWRRGCQIAPGYYLTGDYIAACTVVGGHSLGLHMSLVWADDECRFTTTKAHDDDVAVGALRATAASPVLWDVYLVTTDVSGFSR